MKMKILHDKVYQLNTEKEEYEELNLHGISLAELLKKPESKDMVFALIDWKHLTIWLWYGCNTTAWHKFVGSYKSSSIKTETELNFTRAVFQYQESSQFKLFVGIVEERDLLEEAILNRIESITEPKGYKRDLILAQNKMFKYIESEDNTRLREVEPKQNMEVIMTGYTTRVIYSGSDIDFIELFIPE